MNVAHLGCNFRKIHYFCLTNKSTKPQTMTRIDRITHMEALFDKSEEVVRRLDQALEDFAALQPAIAELEAYYTSSQWRKDFEADEAGKLPKDLKRGVLSEDGLWNLLGDWERLKGITKL